MAAALQMSSWERSARRSLQLIRRPYCLSCSLVVVSNRHRGVKEVRLECLVQIVIGVEQDTCLIERDRAQPCSFGACAWSRIDRRRYRRQPA